MQNDDIPVSSVVRCIDCIHSDFVRNGARYAGENGILKCGGTRTPCYGRLVRKDDYCSYGERTYDAEKAQTEGT